MLLPGLGLESGDALNTLMYRLCELELGIVLLLFIHLFIHSKYLYDKKANGGNDNHSNLAGEIIPVGSSKVKPVLGFQSLEGLFIWAEIVALLMLWQESVTA